MLWLYLALIAYFINAIVFVIDKYLLAGHIPKHYAYTFGVSALSLFSLFLIPLGVSWYGIGYFAIAVLSGFAFFVGLIFLYRTIKDSDVSVAATQTGTFGAIFTYLFSTVVLNETLPSFSLFAFMFLVLGIFLLGKTAKHIFFSAVLAGACLGFSFVLLKLTFNTSDFVNGLFWTRMGFVGGALLSLFSGRVREEIRFSYHHSPRHSKFLFVFNKLLAGIGFIILYFSIRLGSVSLINALLGFQFLFTFLLVLILGGKISGIKEKMDKTVLTSKILGITSVMIGFFFLFR